MAEQALETENASVGLPPVAATPDQRSVTRLNINISRETAEALRALAKDENTSVTNVVRRAVAVYKFLEDKMKGTDKELEIFDPQSEKRATILWDL